MHVFGIHGVVVQVLASLSSHNLLASIIRNHKQKEGWMKAATSLMKCDHYSHNWIDKKKMTCLPVGCWVKEDMSQRRQV
jgi:hypothetical protein